MQVIFNVAFLSLTFPHSAQHNSACDLIGAALSSPVGSFSFRPVGLLGHRQKSAMSIVG